MRTPVFASLIIVLLLGGPVRPASAQAPGTSAADTLAAPVDMTAEEAHQRMMSVLGIDLLRPGPSADPESPNAANMDESAVPEYTLPDPLVTAVPEYTLPDPLVTEEGKRVTTAAQWWQVQRPQIVEAFNRAVYGRVPENVPEVRWKVESTKREMKAGIPVVVKELAGRVDNSSYPLIEVTIDLTVVTPAEAEGPVPAMMHYGWNWPEGVEPPDPKGPTWQEQLLEKGWGYATLIPTSYQADSAAGLTRGIIGLANRGQPRAPDDWGALRAWAWGASRALDYLETDPAVDATQVGIEGLSRYGKAALVAMAYEPRFAIGFIGSSGAGGAKLLRRIFGEQVENLASSAAYHWFAGNFIKYAGPLTPSDLPVDAHELIALCAPRPVFISAGDPDVEGHWVDARGTFLAGVHAGPVYRLLGQEGLGRTTMPPVGVGALNGEIAFRMHEDGHTTGPNWPTFLKYASRYIGTDPSDSAGDSGNNRDSGNTSSSRTESTEEPPPTEGWVGTWSTAVQRTEPRNLPPSPGLAGNTLRQVVHVSQSDDRPRDRLRVRFSNRFGTSPVTLRAAHLAVSLGGGAIAPTTDQALAFDGKPEVTIPAGSTATSDPLAFPLAPLSDVAISVHFGTISSELITGHPGSRTTSYLARGDSVTAPALPGAARTEHWYVIEGIDVDDEEAAAVVTLGNSITDGRGSGTDEQNRWPDELARRLQTDERTEDVAVLNAGIGGNCVLQKCLGPPALDRFERDVLEESGAQWLIVLEGINDIGNAPADRSSAVAQDLIEAYQKMIERAHAHGIRVYGATLLPFGGSFYDSPAHEAARQTVNEWIRTSGAFDGVIDLDVALRDPAHPSRLLPAADSGDHLHPSETGHRMIAEAVDLALFVR